uniref:Uncharacterized protein n=1 Tax=Neobacillus citreus TaxID=2833578 RepID=A0A942YFG5_9BACI
MRARAVSLPGAGCRNLVPDTAPRKNAVWCPEPGSGHSTTEERGVVSGTWFRRGAVRARVVTGAWWSVAVLGLTT